jgi:hypothetical protein
MKELNNPGPAVEEWRPVPTLQHIEASSLGRIRYVGPKRQKIDTGHVLPQRSNNKGYKNVNVPRLDCASQTTRRTMKVHRLVSMAFHGPEPLSNQRMVVGHLDDDPGNNCPDNLRWMTQRDNLNAAACKAKQRAKTFSPETRAKMSAMKQGANHPFYGKPRSIETRTRISAAKREAAARRLEKLAIPEAGNAAHA